MRNLTPEEIKIIGDEGESELGCRAVETTVSELAELNVGTFCGTPGNSCFRELLATGYGDCLCRGWYDVRSNSMMGLFFMAIETDEEVKQVERVTKKGGGCLRFDGDYRLQGFKEFEIE